MKNFTMKQKQIIDAFSSINMRTDLKVKPLNGFMVSGNYANKRTAESAIRLLEISAHVFMHQFMRRINIREFNDSFFTNDKIDPDNYKIDYMVEKIIDYSLYHNALDLVSRIESDNYSAELIVESGAITEIDKTMPAIFMYTDNKIGYTSFYLINIIDYKTVTYVANLGFYISNKYKVDKNQAEKEKMQVCNPLNFGAISYHSKCIHKLLEIIIDSIMKYDEGTDFPIYKQSEVKLFKTIYKDVLGNAVTNHYIEGFTTNYEENTVENRKKVHHNIKEKKKLFEEMNQDPGSDIKGIINNGKCNQNVPLIDFNEKELKFIDNYCEKHELLDNNKTDLLYYLDNPIYGNLLRYNITVDDTESELIAKIELDKENEIMRIRLLNIMKDGFAVIVTADFVDIKNFTFKNSLLVINKEICIRSEGNFYHSFDDYQDKSLLLSITANDIIKLIDMILRINIVIKDRPKRSRMVRRTVKVENKNKVKSTNKNRNHNDQYVVTRILKPIDEAKKYVTEGNSIELHERREAEYVLEEWPRAGHWRTLKSGKQIWISDTTCYRHKELTDKEIHVKL